MATKAKTTAKATPPGPPKAKSKPKVRKVEVVETMIDGGQYWENNQLQVPGHNPVRFDEQGHGWVITRYNGEDRDITALHREAMVKVTDTTRTTTVEVPLD